MIDDTHLSSATPTPSYEALGQYIREMRTKAGLLQPTLAKALNIKQQSVSRWESGKSRPRPSEIPLLAEVLKVNSDELLSLAGYTNTTESATYVKPFPLETLSWQNFERFCAYFLERLYPPPGATVHPLGEGGHAQEGVDIDVIEGKKIYRFQCKRVKNFGPAEVNEAVSAFKGKANTKCILLSKVASPKARRAIESVGHGWDLWDKEDISRKIRQFLTPDDRRKLVDTFFRGQRLALLGEAEPGPWQNFEEFFAPFVQKKNPFNHLWKLVGRTHTVERVLNLVTSNPSAVILLSGAGGTGKSRILKEVFDTYSKDRTAKFVFFAGPSDIKLSDLKDLGKGKKIIVLDDAHNRNDLEQVFQYVSDSENQAVAVLSSRPYGVQNIKSKASTFAINEFSECFIESLSLEESAELAIQVITAYGGDKSAAKMLATATVGCPLATVIGSYIFSKNKMHPEMIKSEEQFRNQILGKFADVIACEIWSPSEADQMKRLLRVMALVQPFTIDDESFYGLVEFMERIPSVDSKQLTQLLSTSGILFKRGGRYRLCPDMLADFIIEKNCIGPDGRSSGYAEKFFERCNGNQLKNLFLNLGKLEWRLKETNATEGNLWTSLWRKLKPTSRYADSHIAAASAAAYYQPKIALEFADELIRKQQFVEQLPELIRNAAYSIDHLPHACESLWEIGKMDVRPLNQHPEHAIRILKEMCEFTPYQPRMFVEVVIDFAINLMREPGICSNPYTPFDILQGVLKSSGHRAVSTRDGLMLESYNIVPHVVAPLRLRVIDAAIDLLNNSNTTLAIKSASLLKNALLFPVNCANYNEWEEHFVEVLLRIEQGLKRTNVHPIVAIQILRSISWHLKYATGKSVPIAQRIAKLQPTTIEFRTLKALYDGWQLYDEEEDDSATEKLTGIEKGRKYLSLLASEILTSFPKAEDLYEFLANHLSDIDNYAPNNLDAASVLMWHLLEQSSELSSLLAERSLRNSHPVLCKFAEFALAKVIQAQHDSELPLAQEYLDSPEEKIRAVVGIAYWRSGVLTRKVTAKDLELLEKMLRDKSTFVAGSVINALLGMSQLDKRKVIDLVHIVDLKEHSSIALNFIGLIDSMDFVRLLTESECTHFLNQLVEVRDLDDHRIQLFVANLSEVRPVVTAQYLMRRVEHSVHSKDYSYSACRLGLFDHVEFHFRKSGDFQFLLSVIVQWMKGRSDKRFRREACDLFVSMFAPIDSEIVEFLKKWSADAGAEDLAIIAEIMRRLPDEFVFDEYEFVTSFLNAISQYGDELLNDAIGSLISPSINGEKSGEFGKPFKKDLMMRDRSIAVLSSLPRFSHAQKVYDSIRKYAEREIAVQENRNKDEDYDDF